MEIRYINQDDDLFEISNIYECSWKSAYKDIIPQSYLDSIPEGRWANRITKEGMNNLVLIENEIAIGTASFCKSRWEQYSDYGEIVSIYFFFVYMVKGFVDYLFYDCVEELISFDCLLFTPFGKS